MLLDPIWQGIKTRSVDHPFLEVDRVELHDSVASREGVNSVTLGGYDGVMCHRAHGVSL